MDARQIIDCLILIMFCVAAGFNLWDMMLGEARKKRILFDAIVGLIVLLLWVGSEINYLFC